MTSIIQLIVLDWRVEPEERMQERRMPKTKLSTLMDQCFKGEASTSNLTYH